MWLDKLYENAYLYTPYRFHDYQLTITAPDGTNTTQSFPIIYDTTSAQDYAFTPDATGTYKVTFNFPGQTITASNAAPGDAFINDTYQASSASTTLTVQSSPIAAASQGAPLPTAYWTRPIYGENTNWYTLASNWLGTTWPGYAAWGTFTANSQSSPGDAVGSLTSHIMWTKPIQSRRSSRRKQLSSTTSKHMVRRISLQPKIRQPDNRRRNAHLQPTDRMVWCRWRNR